MLKQLVNRISAAIHPEKIDNAIERAARFIEEYEQIAPTARTDAIHPDIIYSALLTNGLDNDVKDIIAYADGKKEHPSQDVIQLIEDLWEHQIESDETQESDCKDDKILIRAQSYFQYTEFEHTPDTPVYTVFQDWKAAMNYSDFLENIDNSLSNFQAILENQLNILDEMVDQDSGAVIAITKSPERKEEIKNNALVLRSIHDQIPLLRKDFGLPEIPKQMILLSLNELRTSARGDLTNG